MQSPGLKHWYPHWSKQLADAYAGSTRQFFVLHGNVSDIVRVEKEKSAAYTMLPEFLATQLFGTWDAVIYFDQVRGPRALANSQQRLSQINSHLERFIGPVEELRNTRQVGQVFAVLELKERRELPPFHRRTKRVARVLHGLTPMRGGPGRVRLRERRVHGRHGSQQLGIVRPRHSLLEDRADLLQPRGTVVEVSDRRRLLVLQRGEIHPADGVIRPDSRGVLPECPGAGPVSRLSPRDRAQAAESSII